MAVVSLLMLAACISLAAAEPGARIDFVGGTVPVKSSARLNLTGPDELVFQGSKTILIIAYDKVNTLEYGQNVSRRYAAAILISPVLLLSKSRKHFVTLGYVDAEGRQQALVFRFE